MTSSIVQGRINSTLPSDFQEKYDSHIAELKTILADHPKELDGLLKYLHEGSYTLFALELVVVSNTFSILMTDVEDIVLSVTKGLACVGAGHDEDAIARQVGMRVIAKRATYRAFCAFTVKWAKFVDFHGGQIKLGYLAKHQRFDTRI